MKLLIPTIDYPPIEGGISTLCLQLARECAAMGHEVTVFAPWFPGMESYDDAEPYRIVRFKGYEAGWLRLLPFLRGAWSLARHTDCVLAINVAYGGVLGRLARARHGTPYLCFAYAYEFLKFSQATPARALLRSIYRHAHATIAISAYTRSSLIDFGAPADRVRVALPGASAPSPHDAERMRRLRERLGLGDAPFVLSVGRFIPRKNHALLVEAWTAVHAAHPDAHLVMVGRGPEQRACADRAAALGLDRCIHLPGYLDDDEVSLLFHDCAYFALPNGEDRAGQVEGFGLVFAEAAAHGKAVIAGDSGGVREAVLDGKTGLLVPPGNADALAVAMLRLMGDMPLRDELGRAGRERVEQELNWQRFAEGVLAATEYCP